jgi:hypothetical protein
MKREPAITNNFERQFPRRIFEDVKPDAKNLNPEFTGFPCNTDKIKLENFPLTRQNRINYISALRYSLNPEQLFIIERIPKDQAVHLAVSIIKLMPPIEISPIQKFEVEREILSRIKIDPDNPFLKEYYKSRNWYFRSRKIFYINEETLDDIFNFDYIRKFDSFVIEFLTRPRIKILLRSLILQKKNLILLKDNLAQYPNSFN